MKKVDYDTPATIFRLQYSGSNNVFMLWIMSWSRATNFNDTP
jgi:hypothetical protein